MVKVYDHNFTRKDISKLRNGNVIIFSPKSDPKENNYLFVESYDVYKDKICGEHIIEKGSVNLSVEEIVNS